MREDVLFMGLFDTFPSGRTERNDGTRHRMIWAKLDAILGGQRIMNTNIDLTGAVFIICATVLFIMFHGDPDLHDAIIAALQRPTP